MNNNWKFFFVVWFILLLSFAIIQNVDISKITLFDSMNLFTYFGVLIGFAITVYTFGLSLLDEIKLNIKQHKKFDDAKKLELKSKLNNSFIQLKENIWLIFIAIILIAIFSILKLIPNNYIDNVEKYKIPETVNMSLFILTTFAVYDIIKTIFGLTSIKNELE
jgi:multisubunit Na+/H+ antiporter MnhB subunit